MQYSGVIQNLQAASKMSKAGSPYNVYTFNLDTVNTPFKDLFIKGFNPANGMRVMVVEGSKNVNGKVYKNFEVTQDNGQAQGNAAPAAPAQRAYGARDESTQQAIRRQWSIGQANVLLTTLITNGVVKPAVLKKGEAAVIGLLGHYAKILYDATENDDLFDDLQNFSGEINEGQMPDDE